MLAPVEDDAAATPETAAFMMPPASTDEVPQPQADRPTATGSQVTAAGTDTSAPAGGASTAHPTGGTSAPAVPAG